MPTKDSGVRAGILWSVGLAAATVGVQVGHTLLAARLLTPAEFGQFAISLTVVALVNYAVTAGLGVSIARSEEPTKPAESTALVFALVGGLLFGTAAMLTAPFVAQHFGGDDRMIHLMRLLAPYSLLTAVVIVGVSTLRRRGHYRRAALIESGAIVLGLTISATALISGLGIKSLAIGLVVGQATGAVLVLHVLSFPKYHSAAAKRLAYFASHVGLQNFAHFCTYTSPIWILGATSSLADVGNFSRAWALVTLPLGQVMLSVTKILQSAYPHAARDDRSPAAARQAARAFTVGVSLFLPLFCWAAFGAPLVVETLLGKDWADAARVASFLVGFGFLNLLYTLSASACESYELMRRIWIGILVFATILTLVVILGLRTGGEPLETVVGAVLIGQATALLPYVIFIVPISGGIVATTFLAATFSTLQPLTAPWTPVVIVGFLAATYCGVTGLIIKRKGLI